MLSNRKFNFSKRRLAANVICTLLKHKSEKYEFDPIPGLQHTLNYAIENAGQMDKLYNLSMEVEPRDLKEAIRLEKVPRSIRRLWIARAWLVRFPGYNI